MKICAQCQQENPDQAKFCFHCGVKLTEERSKIHRPEADQAERRQLTILFCDLVDSTPLSERMDPEDYRQMILDYHEVAEEVVRRFGGNVGNYLGDGLLVYFGYPEGLENAAITGVQTGLAITEAMAEVRERWENQKDIYVKVRVGIHTGVVIVDEHLALGETVNIAARLEGLAPHNGVVVSPKTYHLIKGWFEVKSLGEKALKGITEPMEIYEVISESGARTRLDIARGKGLSPLVGREAQLQQLRESWSQAKKGKGSSILLSGEAGIGKSRLTDKLENEVTQEPGGMVLEARCSTYHSNSAFHPLLELIQNDLIGIRSSDVEATKAEKLENYLKILSQGDGELLPLFAEYLGISLPNFAPLAISPFAKREKIMHGIGRVFIDLARDKNVLLVIEDLHWADASTVEWIQTFVPKLPEHNILLLSTSRPSLRHDLKQNPGMGQVEIERLTPKDMKEICLHQSKGKVLPSEIMDKIVEKTEGVPLFVEELTKMVLESDRLVEKNDHFELSGSLSAMDIPSTLQDSLLARMDQLKDVKKIVQVSSVIGRDISLEMLHAMMPEEGKKMDRAIAKLLDAEIFQKAEPGQQADYRFKHALIQDTAYGSMLRRRRQQIHKKFARVLDEEFKELNEKQPEILAHHLTEANEPLEAIPKWLQAGQIANKTNAAREAIAHLNKGLELLTHVRDQEQKRNLELDFKLTLGGTYIISHGFPHPLVKETFNQAMDIAQTMEVSPKLALIIFGLLNYYFNTEDYKAFDEACEHMDLLSDDPEFGYWFKLFLTHFKGGIMTRGDIRNTLPYFKKALEMFDPSLPFPWELTPSGYLPHGTRGWWMFGLQIAGYPDQAEKLCEEQLTYTDKEHQDSTSLYHIYTFPALYSLEARKWEQCQNILERYLPLARSFGDPIFVLTAEVYDSISRSFQGDPASFEKAVNMIHVCFDIGFKAFAVTMSALIAEGYLIHGKPQDSLKWIEKILDHVNQTGTHVQTAQLYRVKGLALQELGSGDQSVETEFKKAMDLAEKQGAGTFRLRAAMELARLWHSNGNTSKAQQLLQEVYDGFTEGFDSVDLTGARNLLQQLSAE